MLAMRRSPRVRTPHAALAVKVESAVRGVGELGSVASTKARSKGKRTLSQLAVKSEADVALVQEEGLSKKIKAEFHGPSRTAEGVAIKTEERLTFKSDGGGSGAGEASKWRDLCATVELSCVVTLTSGQVFTWKRHADNDSWVGVIGRHVFKLREREERVQYQLLHPLDLADEQAHAVLHDYFRLEMEAAPLYKLWSEKDDNMSKIIRSLPGLRIIRQDPVECLFAFICSSNNNIQRITQMIEKLKATYGELLLKDPVSSDEFYAFPTVEAMATVVEEQKLRDLGFGYRAPFIVKSSQLLRQLGGRDYLLKLRQGSTTDNPDEYAEKLMAFTGVGRKVADCIGLFSLDQLHAIPVDTHVWQIACREFDPTLKSKKSLTPTIYKAVGDHFRARFSPLAGWAHSVLFTGDLTSFQTHLPEEMQKKNTKKPALTKKSESKKPKRTSETDLKKEEDGGKEHEVVKVTKGTKTLKRNRKDS